MLLWHRLVRPFAACKILIGQSSGKGKTMRNSSMFLGGVAAVALVVLPGFASADEQLVCVPACKFDPISGVIGVQF
jgi:hypothetical protein